MDLSTQSLCLPADGAIDLHLHTTYSDGRWTVETLFSYLLAEQFALVAITDHDRADMLTGIQQVASEMHLPVLVGIELTAGWRGELVDMLCYGFDPTQNPLRALTQDLLRRQKENTRQAFEYLLRQGLNLSLEELPALLAKPTAEQPHAFVRYVEAQGYSFSDPAMSDILSESGVTFATNEPAAIVEAAHRSGGVCLLAHPGRGDGFVTFDVELLDQFREEAPVDGLEVDHPKNIPAQIGMYREYAQSHHLLTSAGSDSHGPEKSPIKYRAELCRDLLERVGVRVMW